MKKKLYIEVLFLITLGMLTSLSLPPLNFFIINFLTFSLFFLFLIRKNEKTRGVIFFLYGWSFGFGYFITNLYWISISLTFDQDFKFLIPLTIFLIPGFLAIFYGLAAFLFKILKPKTKISSILTFSLILGVMEFLRGSILTGFPWNLIVYSFSDLLKFISITSILGTYALNLFCISLFTIPSIFFLSSNKKKDFSVGIIIFLIAISFNVYGLSHKGKFDRAIADINEYKIRIIGSNISLDRFYLDIDPVSVIEDLVEISNPNLNEKTIFVWPEGILPKISQQELIEYNWLFKKKFNENHLLVIGTNNFIDIDGSKKYFNSLSVFDNKLRILYSYNKINLVPFGEFLPFENLLRNFGLKSLTNNYQSFTSGFERNIIDINKDNFSLKILPLICYEIIYSGQINNSEKNYDFILNISEDGWFGNSIGPYQHYSHSIFRSIEEGKPVIRSSNNGISAFINPRGQVIDKILTTDKGFIEIQSFKKSNKTIFSSHGNKIFFYFLSIYISLIFFFKTREN